jgi:hypothetical protein
MQRPLTYSIILHLVVIIFLWVGFYNPFEKNLPSEQPLMIEFVQVAERSAAPSLAPEVMHKPIQKAEPPKPAPPPQPEDKPKNPEPADVPPPELAKPEPVKPELAKPLPQPVPEPTPVEADPIPDPAVKPKPPVKPAQEKPKVQKAEITLEKKKTPDIKKDEKEIDKKKKSSSASPDDQDKKKKPAKSFDDILSENSTSDDSTPSSGRGSPASTIGPVLTASEIDAIRQRIYKCWIVPAGARGAKDMVVDIDLDVARDGTVTRADVVDKRRMATDTHFRSAAESARRAVMDPRCNPLPIPPEKYDQFKHFTFGFNPKDMF